MHPHPWIPNVPPTSSQPVSPLQPPCLSCRFSPKRSAKCWFHNTWRFIYLFICPNREYTFIFSVHLYSFHARVRFRVWSRGCAHTMPSSVTWSLWPWGNFSPVKNTEKSVGLRTECQATEPSGKLLRRHPELGACFRVPLEATCSSPINNNS